MIFGPYAQRFLACRACRRLVPAPSDSVANNGFDPELAARRDEFAAQHHQHGLFELRRTERESISEGPLWDPMVKVHIELTDDNRLYVATAARPSIEEERVYIFRPCALRTVSSEVDIADGDVRRGLDMEFFPHAVRPTKVDDFLGALHEAIRDLATDELEIAFIDADDPAVSIAPMPEQAVERVLLASSKIFDPWEFPLVERFLRENRQETGVLALRVRRNAALVDD